MKLICVILLMALAIRTQGNSLLCYVCDGDECDNDSKIRIESCGPHGTTTTPVYTTVTTETTKHETESTSIDTETTPSITETTQATTDSTPGATEETTLSPTENSPIVSTESTSAPAESTQAPAESTPVVPTEPTSAPAESTQAPAESSTVVPTEPTSTPMESTQAPTENTPIVPTEPSSEPAESTQSPTENTPVAPTDPTSAPAESAPGDELISTILVKTLQKNPSLPSSEIKLLQNRSISASSAIINNYRRISRTRRESNKLSYSCYSVQYKDGDKTKQQKGCVAIPTEMSACAVVAEKIENVVENSCKPCVGELCNSSSMLGLSILTLLVAIFIKILI